MPAAAKISPAPTDFIDRVGIRISLSPSVVFNHRKPNPRSRFNHNAYNITTLDNFFNDWLSVAQLLGYCLTLDMFDCHNHTLPKIDDGAHDLDMALEMARVAVSNGIKTVFVTPHHLNGVFNNPRKTILKHLIEFRGRLADEEISLELFPGSELHLVPEIVGQILEGEALSFADKGKAALVELPKRTVPTGTEAILGKLIYHGITPVIAHPERNSSLAQDPSRVLEWVDWGCKLQLTAQSCAGDFGEPIQDFCERLCRTGAAHLIASDAHRVEGRAPNLRPGYEQVTDWIGVEAADLMVRDNPKRLLSGEPLVAPVTTHLDRSVAKQSWLSRVFKK